MPKLFKLSIIFIILISSYIGFHDIKGTDTTIHQGPTIPGIAGPGGSKVVSLAINDFTYLPFNITPKLQVYIGTKVYNINAFEAITLGYNKSSHFMQSAHILVFQLDKTIFDNIQANGGFARITYSNGISHDISLKNIEKFN